MSYATMTATIWGFNFNFNDVDLRAPKS